MKTLSQVQRQRKILNAILAVIFVLSFLCLAGFVVALFFLGFHKGDEFLIAVLCASFFGGGCLFGILGLFLFRLGDKMASTELDLLEREDGEYSFFVGEGTLATFEDETLRIHGRDGGKKDIVIPYYDLKFYSVCTRRAPREKGFFSVVIEIPSRYFNNNASRDMPCVLIQTDGKERLYRRIAELNLTLVGEPFCEQEKGKKFKTEQKFSFWHPVKLKKALILTAIGALVLIGGVIAMILLREHGTPGSIMVVLGIYCVIRGVIALFGSIAELRLYREGVYYRDPEGINSVFLKWEEFSSVRVTEKEEKKFLTCRCPYGDYDLPYFEGAYEEIVKELPDKAGEESV